MNGATHAITYLFKYTFMRRLKKNIKIYRQKIYIFIWFAIPTPYKKCKNLFKCVYFCLQSARQQCPHNGLIILSARICPGIVIWFAPDLMYFA